MRSMGLMVLLLFGDGVESSLLSFSRSLVVRHGRPVELVAVVPTVSKFGHIPFFLESCVGQLRRPVGLGDPVSTDKALKRWLISVLCIGFENPTFLGLAFPSDVTPVGVVLCSSWVVCTGCGTGTGGCLVACFIISPSSF